MKYYITPDGTVHAFDHDGSQDHLIADDMQAISEQEAAELTAPADPTLEEWRASAVVSSRQGLQQLILAGLDEQVDAAIEGNADTVERKLTRAWFDKAGEWERMNPQLIDLGHALELTDEQIDQLFRDAAKL